MISIKKSMELFKYIRPTPLIICMTMFIGLLSMAYTEEIEQITIQLKWQHQFQFAGYYAAIEKGFYADEGLEVKLRERNPDTQIVNEVLKGNAEYGISDAGLLVDRAEGHPVVLLSQIFQYSPLVLLTMKESGITSPEDLAGKKVMIDLSGTSDAPVHAMLKNEIGDISQFEAVPHSFNLEDLITGKVDAVAAYITNEPFQLKQKGLSYYLIPPRDYGFDQYGDNLFTTEKEIRDHPQRVEKVIRATVKGWEYALQNQDEIISLIIEKYAPELTREHLTFEAKMIELSVLPYLVPIGQISSGRYRKITENFNKLGLIKQQTVPDGFIYQQPTPVKSGINLTPLEKTWLEAHSVIRVGSSPDYIPFNYRIDEKPAGYGIDLITLLADRLGISVEFVPELFSKQVELIKSKELDLLTSVYKTPERNNFLNFSQSYKSADIGIFTQIDRNDLGSLENLAGKTVALASGDAMASALEKAYPDIIRTFTENYLEALRMVATGKADATIQQIAVGTYLSREYSLSNLQIFGGINESEYEAMNFHIQDYHIGIRKDWPELASILDKTIKGITREEWKTLDERWITLPPKAIKVELTLSEKKWIGEHPVIRVASDPYWAPFEFRDEKGEFHGVSIDYLNTLEEILGIQFVIEKEQDWQELIEGAKKQEIDMFSSLSITPERSEYLNFTKPYITIPVSIFARNDVAYIGDLSKLNGEKVAVVSGYAVEEWLSRDYPGIELIPVTTTQEAIEELQSGKVFAFVGNLVTTGYYLGQTKVTDIKVTGNTQYEYQQTMAVRKDWPMFKSILQKAIDAIPESRHNEIYRSWLAVKYEQDVDYTLLWRILAIAGLVLAVFLFWNRRLSREIDKKRIIQKELQLAKETAEAANSAKSTFLANMSHDLRTPLNAMLGFTQILERDKTLGEEQREEISIISRSSKNLLSLINDVLDIAKIESGQAVLRENSFDLYAFLRGISELFHSQAVEKNLFFILERDEDIPRYVKCDEGKLRQVLINLLGNALKFTDRGGVTLRVRSGDTIENIPTLLFEVEDTGIGIDADYLEKVFDPYIQSSDIADKTTGTGLGLSISRQFVNLMGGRIEIESKINSGTLFRFGVAVCRAEASEIEDSLQSRRVTGLAPDQSSYRILVVEDILESRKLLVKLLKTVGFEVQEALNGKQGVEIFKSWHPDLIWMDMRMPVMDGFEATKEIKKTENGLKTIIIALTAQAFEEEREKILNAGCDDFIRKPFIEEELFAVMEKHLGIQYLYDIQDVLTQVLTPENLSEIPEDIKSDLLKVTAVLDQKGCFSILKKLSITNKEIASALYSLVDNYQFEELEKVLKQKGLE